MARITQEKYNQLLQAGLSPERIASIAKTRGDILPSGDIGFSGFAKGFTKGFAKGLIGDVARPTAQLAQGFGQRVLATVTPARLEDVRRTTGFESLKPETPEGKGVEEILETKTPAEKAGRITANVASFFVPASKGTQVAGRTTTELGRLVSKLGIGVSAKEAPLIQSYRAKHPVLNRVWAAFQGKTPKGNPITNRETALRQGIFGTESMIGVQAKKASSNLWKEVISPALEGSKTKIQMPKFLDEVGEEINKINDPTRKRQLTEALSSMKDDFKGIGEITLKELQNFKEGWAKFIPEKVYKGKPIAGAFREVQNLSAQLARNKIYRELGDEVRAAYFDYGNLKNLEALGQKALTASKLKGGAGSFISAVKDIALTPIATTAGLTLYKAGKLAEFVGTAGLKKVSDIFGL